MFFFDSIYSKTPLNKLARLEATNSQYQSFTLNESSSLSYLLWNFYSDTKCTTLLNSVQVGSGTSTALPAGTYTTNEAANYNICQAYSGGCNLEFESTSSINVTYVYSPGSMATGQCYNNASSGDKLANNSSTPALCTANNCSYTGTYASDLLSL